MSDAGYIAGFSKLDFEEKAKCIAKLTSDGRKFIRSLKDHKHPEKAIQILYEGFSENNLTNFHLPFGIAPNFLINDKIYHVPMVIEESSVVAAAASAAKFWFRRGGYHCKVRSTTKKGHVHFIWKGDPAKLEYLFKHEKDNLLKALEPETNNMIKRGGGITGCKLVKKPEILMNYYQLEVSFETVDAMGANFINTCLESIASEWKHIIGTYERFDRKERECEIIMAILSNYTSECIVECDVSCKTEDLADERIGMSGKQFADKFIRAVQISRKDINRAVTHNKGIFNGIDAVVMATGNDYRAVEAAGHAFAAKEGRYHGLSKAWIAEDLFKFHLELPMTVGTVGGLTKSHPMAAYALEILGKPKAEELMNIIAAVGLANNFSAIRSLITSGIQQGHMKLHLSNILRQLAADEKEKQQVYQEFESRKVTYSAVQEFLNTIRKK